MQMILRWFGTGEDPVSLQQIAQIPGVTGVATSILNMPAGELWPQEIINEMKNTVENSGLKAEVIESVNIHEDIKLGLPSRDDKIDNYIKTIRNLSAAGVKVICYNFMPILDWARSDLFYDLPDGSNTMRYDPALINKVTPEELAVRYKQQNKEYEMPGWEPERLKTMNKYLELYSQISTDKIWDNMKYFLDAIIPVCEECGLNMAIHPDDPPWPIFGLPRLIINRDNLRKFLSLNKSKNNGLTLCTGSLGANPDNNIPEIIREFGGDGRIHFAHVRNLKYQENGAFYESAHLSSAGSLDIFEIMKAFHDVGFDGYVRPDHGRMIWGEKGRPGYGLYDRALGAAYINGIWEAIKKMTSGK